MAAEEEESAWMVVISYAEDTSLDRILHRQPSDTVGEVRRAWSDKVAFPHPFVLLSGDGRELGATERLDAVGHALSEEIGPPLVRVHVARTVLVEVQVYGGEGHAQVAARLRQRPEELHPAVRGLLGLPAGLGFRLRLPHRLLAYDRGLAEADFAGPLQVDRAFEAAVREVWTGRTRQHLLFGSDAAAELLGGAGPGRRLTNGGRAVDAGGDVLGALGRLGEGGAELALQLHVSRGLALLSRARQAPLAAWPMERVGAAVAGYLPPWAPLLLDGRPLRRGAAFVHVAPPEDALLVAEPVRLVVARADLERRQVVRVASQATLGDVLARLWPQPHGRLHLSAAGRPLPPSLGLQEAGLDCGDELAAAERNQEVHVWLGGREIPWTTDRLPVRFSDLVHQLARRTGEPYRRLNALVLCCRGCGRRLTKAAERAQLIPAPCCDKRSLELEEPKPTADATTQAYTAEKQPRQYKKVSARPTMRSRGVQAVKYWHQVGCQTDPSLELAIPFHVINRTDFRQRRNLSGDLTVAASLTVGDVRAWVASQLQAEPRVLEVWRCVGSSRDGAFCALVCDARGGHSNQYGSADGRILDRKELRSHDYVELVDDSAAFVVVPGRRNIIRIDVS